ncbi:MAG: three-Cys-motif partner protein TcmP [Candidatus Marinimicrobia bacterium]|nr:three-Cys-motif partner protein TcmP [Candidatus Neomarinimicrobiota bacterium]
MNPFANQNDDGLATPEVGPWAEEKYKLLFNYANTFATSMKKKWDQRVYIDLFSAAGKSRIRETGRIVLSSSLLALNVTDPFDKYIFCEEKPELIMALRRRVNQDHAGIDVHYVEGDINRMVGDVIREMPTFSKTNRVLGFCFVDPGKMRDLKFTTISLLSARWMDFLILIPTDMDARRNPINYERETNTTVAEFLGVSSWREPWFEKKDTGLSFSKFIARSFHKEMKSIGFHYGGIDETVLVRSAMKNLPLYRLGFFSRHKLGGIFWRDAKKYSIIQTNLFE